MAQVAQLPSFGSGSLRQGSFDKPRTVSQEEEEVVTVRCVFDACRRCKMSEPSSSLHQGFPYCHTYTVSKRSCLFQGHTWR